MVRLRASSTPDGAVTDGAVTDGAVTDVAVTDVAVVLGRGGGAEAPAKLGELLVHLRPARLGVWRYRFGVHGTELGILLPIQLHLDGGEQLVEEVAAGLPRA